MHSRHLLIAIALACSLLACKKSSTTPAPMPSASLAVILRHHGSTSVIDSATFYLASLAAFVSPGEGFNATARGIRNGDLTIGSFTYVGTDSLYIYARAYDTALHAHIDGAMKYAVSSATAKDIVYLDMADTTGTYPIYLVMF